VRVSLDSDDEAAPADVLAISTESRDAGADLFRRALDEGLRRLPALRPRILFKKIDSTLRGNVGPEVAATLAAFACDVAVVTPAFPAMGRTVAGGYLSVAGPQGFIPLEVAACFHGQAPHVPCHAQPGALSRAIATGARFVLADAACDADLDAIVREGLTLRCRVLWAGSAGLSAALARATGVSAPGRPAPSAAAVVFCLGSNHAVTLEQQHRLLHHRRAALFTVEDAAPADILGALDRGQHAVLRIVLGDAANGRLRELLANTARPLVLSGGTTAALVCKALDIRAIDLRQEVAPGIPYGLVRGGPCEDLPVVTKSGGFGGPDALMQVADFFTCPQR
jgi:uncharacterized protein YgbK (DUF1537 family)